jgi:betaine-homocysteine S-methyltransferase
MRRAYPRRPRHEHELVTVAGMRGIRERLDEGVVVGAEGYLFELERRGYLKGGPFVPEVVLDFPDAVRELHREFLRAGAEVMVAFTYYAHRDKLRTIGREADLEPLNRQALRLAREVAAESDALVAGNICNTWVYDPDAPDSSGETVREMYREQVGWAVEEGADLIISETHDYLGEALISLEAIQESGLPSIVTFASTDDVTIDGYEYDEACSRLEAKGADVVGLNCSRGPATMLPLLERITAAVDCHVAAQPVPYRTTPAQANFEALKDADGVRGFPLALEPFLCNRFELADFAVAARDLGVRYIGLCCGGAPHYIRSMAERLGRTVPASRYSPDMAQHPILGENVGEQAKRFVNWKD